jgi:hypothetical protein
MWQSGPHANRLPKLGSRLVPSPLRGNRYEILAPSQEGATKANRIKVGLGIHHQGVMKHQSQLKEKWDPKLRDELGEISDHTKELGRKLLKEWQSKGWIQKVSLEQAALVTAGKWIAKIDEKGLVRDDKIRLTAAFLYLNAKSENWSVNYPKEDELLELMKGYTWGAKMDISDGYWQMELKEEDQPYTCFYALGEVYMYRRLPQGHANSCYLFHEGIRAMIEDLEWAVNYIDDIVILGNSKKDVTQKISLIKKRLAEKGMEVESSKTSEPQQGAIEFLRWEWQLGTNPSVGNAEWRVSKSMKLMEDLPARVEVGKIGSILGTLNYALRGKGPILELQELRSRIGNPKHEQSEKIANPFTRVLQDKILAKLNLRVEWGMNAPKSRSTWVWADASNWGLGVVILTGVKRRQWYYWHCKRPVEHTRIIENEAMAAMAALRMLAEMGRANAEIFVDNPTTWKVLMGKMPKTKVVDIGGLREEVKRSHLTWKVTLVNKSNEPEEMKIADQLSRGAIGEAIEQLKGSQEEWKARNGAFHTYTISKGLWWYGDLLKPAESRQKDLEAT